MCLVDAKRIQHAHRIRCHVGQRIGHLRVFPGKNFAQYFTHIGHAQFREFLRQPHIAIVKPQHMKTACGEPLHQFHRPLNKLRAEPHHKNDGGVVLVTKCFDLNVDTVCLDLHPVASQRLVCF